MTCAKGLNGRVDVIYKYSEKHNISYSTNQEKVKK